MEIILPWFSLLLEEQFTVKMPPREVNPHEGALLSNLTDTVWQIELVALLRTADDCRPRQI